jgi:DNA replication protein DnaC
MFIQPTIDKLHALKLTGMADAVRKQLEDPGASQLSFEERLGLIIDHHWSWKENQALQRRLMNSKLRRDACIEDIDWQHVRGLDRGLVRSLATSDWVRKHHQLLLTGPTGVGKSFLASAFAQRACRDGFTAFYTRAAQLFRSLEVARADGSFGSLLHRLGQVDVLVVDDFAMPPWLTRSAAISWRSVKSAMTCDPRSLYQPGTSHQMARPGRRSDVGR